MICAGYNLRCEALSSQNASFLMHPNIRAVPLRCCEFFIEESVFSRPRGAWNGSPTIDHLLQSAFSWLCRQLTTTESSWSEDGTSGSALVQSLELHATSPGRLPIKWRTASQSPLVCWLGALRPGPGRVSWLGAARVMNCCCLSACPVSLLVWLGDTVPWDFEYTKDITALHLHTDTQTAVPGTPWWDLARWSNGEPTDECEALVCSLVTPLFAISQPRRWQFEPWSDSSQIHDVECWKQPYTYRTWINRNIRLWI